jgi:hypothetical protein
MADEEVTPQEETQPTLEDLQRQAQEAAERAEKAEAAYKEIQRKESRLAERERKLTVNEERLAQWEKRFDDHDLQLAALMDALEEQRGEPLEAERKVSRVDKILQERKSKAEPQPEPRLSAEEVGYKEVAMDIMQERGWTEGSEPYKKTLEVLARTGSFRDVVRSLRTSEKAEDDQKAKNAAEAEKVKKQQQLKEEGAAGSESGPSATSLDDGEFLDRFHKGELSSPDDFARADKILKNMT